MAENVKAPFTKEQVRNIKKYQKSGHRHPFTCRGEHCVRSERDDQGLLTATTEGMVCGCGKYTQDWVYPFMAEKQPPKGFWQLRIPVPFCNVEFRLIIKWKETWSNYIQPWIGLGFYPKKFKINKK